MNDIEFTENVYYYPEKSGMEIVTQLELSEPCYSFDTQVVWRVKGKKKLYTAHDSGCSCPTPFEDYHKLSDLTPITNAVIEELKREIRQHEYVTPTQFQEFFEAIRNG